MKLGISVQYHDLEGLKKILTSSSLKIEHVELNSLPAEVKSLEDTIMPLINLAKSYNPDITLSFHAYPYNISESVDSVRDLWIKLSKDTIALGLNLGVEFVNFHLGHALYASNRCRHDDFLGTMITSLNSLTDHANGKNINIHIENMYSEVRGSTFSKFGDRSSDFNFIFEANQCEHLKICYDYGHGNIDEHGIDILRNRISNIGSLHVHDNDQLADIHWPMNNDLGTIDWFAEYKFLKENNFEGCFILESYTSDQLLSIEFMDENNWFNKIDD